MCTYSPFSQNFFNWLNRYSRCCIISYWGTLPLVLLYDIGIILFCRYKFVLYIMSVFFWLLSLCQSLEHSHFWAYSPFSQNFFNWLNRYSRCSIISYWGMLPLVLLYDIGIILFCWYKFVLYIMSVVFWLLSLCQSFIKSKPLLWLTITSLFVCASAMFNLSLRTLLPTSHFLYQVWVLTDLMFSGTC